MKLIGKRGVTGAMVVIVTILMLFGAAILAAMPWWLKAYLTQRGMAEYFVHYFVLILISGLIAEVVMWKGRCLMSNINNIGPFIMDNAKILRHIGACCAAVTAEYIVAVPFIPSVFTVLIALAFAVVTLLCFVFAELFRQAVTFKEENELTI